MNHSFEFVWLNKWVFVFAHLSTNLNIRRLGKKFLSDWDKEIMADSIVEKILAEASQNPDDKFCQSIVSSFQREEAFRQEKCDLAKWVSSKLGDRNFERNLLESKLAELENQRQETLEALEALKRLKT
jgi:hypothetical protein